MSTKTHSILLLALRLTLALAIVLPNVLSAALPAAAAPARDDCGQGNGNGNGCPSDSGSDCSGLALCPLVNLFYRFAREIIGALLAAVFAGVALGWATGMFGAKIGKLLGNPMAVSHGWDKALGTTVFGILTILSPTIVDAIARAMAGSINPHNIVIPHF
jgi:hypothetical protein